MDLVLKINIPSLMTVKTMAFKDTQTVREASDLILEKNNILKKEGNFSLSENK